MTTGTTKVPARTILLLGLVIIVLAVPAIAVSFSPLSSAVMMVLAGSSAGVVASLNSTRLAVGAVVVSALLMGLAQVAREPWPAAALMAIVGLGIGACSLKGWHPAAVQAAVWPATLLIEPAFSLPGHQWADGGWGRALVPALLVLLGGLWAAGVAGLLGSRLPRMVPQPVDRVSACLYAGVLAVLLGVVAYLTAELLPGSMAGWVLLTVLVMVKPAVADTRTRLIARSTGTVLGGLVAALLALIVPVPAALATVGVLALIVALALYATGGKYALYAFALTAAIVLLNSQGKNVLTIDLQRVGFTLAGALLIAVFAQVYEPGLRAVRHRARQ